MKDNKHDSTTVLSRFAKDQRERSSSEGSVERRPRLQRDADGGGHGADTNRRTSFNPNFSEDNRRKDGDRDHGFGRRDDDRRSGMGYGGPKKFEKKESGSGAERSYGDRPSYGGDKPRSYNNDRPSYGGDKPRSYGNDRPSYGGDKPRSYNNDRPSYGGDKPRSYGNDRPSYGGDKPRSYNNDRPFYGGDKPRSYGNDRPSYGGYKKSGDKPYVRDGEHRGSYRNDKPSSYPKYNPNVQTGEIRLNRFVAQSGICSRREADDFITAGLVSVNGVVVTTLGTKVMPTDEVKFNDSKVEGEKKVYLVLNKPKGYVTTLEDPHADKTVMELVKEACTERIYPVGRLDKNSVGLLLFTNDGDLTKQLTHPSYRKKKIYQVSLDKPLTRADMDAVAEGVTLEDGEIHADEISYVKENKQEVGVEIHSGRNRIVRRIFEHLGYTVKKLDRVYYAGLTKKNLKRGGWRFLSNDEVIRLKSGQYE